ncbi:putative UROD MetE-like protein [Lyophyllum shimeji]|uniref:UROD MetE-like protein n=1 Tax=Lyophyllum shimeji TaxID=47721 RepID=A0A9P3PUF1_LYOSH|nr:putative UROD MetE-like protein [Lyophyllum shimeji]
MSRRALHVLPPFRAEHVGSFIRPAALYEKRLLFESEQCSREDLKELEDEAIKDVVKMQQAAGIKTITDGELRRAIFWEGVFNNLEGMKALKRPIKAFKKYVPHVATQYAAGVIEAPTFFCDGKIKRTKPFYVEEFKYLKNLVAPEDVKNIKITMCAPSWIHLRHGSLETYDLSVYKNDDEYFEDLGVAYRAEINELYENGCRHIQIDNPIFCYFCSESMISGMEAEGIDHEALLDTYIRSMNLCTQGRPDDLTFGVHMCRGNYRGKHFSEGSYQRIAVKLFNDLDVDAFYLEYDNERAGDFAPLAHLPRNKTAVLGLVTTKKPELETVEELEARINEAVDAICKGDPERTREQALNQLCISPQCGFASAWQGNPVTEDDQRKKLELLVATARRVWGDSNV